MTTTPRAIHSPHHGHSVRLGRNRPTSRPKLHLRNYLAPGTLPTPPSSCDYSAKAAATLADIYENDTLGDCVIAGGYHVVGVETGNAGAEYHATKQQITRDYSAIGGYVPGDSATDQGCELPTALAYWQKNGFANGTKLLGHLAVDASNAHEVMLALYLFENLYFGIELPDAWVSPFPSGPGFTWGVAGAADPQNGHCIMGVGYDTSGVAIDSWGMLGKLTWAAAAKYAVPHAGGELHVMLTPDQLQKGQAKAPNGIDWDALVADFGSLGGAAPLPAPAPSPAPGSKLAIGDVVALLQKSWPK